MEWLALTFLSLIIFIVSAHEFKKRMRSDVYFYGQFSLKAKKCMVWMFISLLCVLYSLINLFRYAQ